MLNNRKRGPSDVEGNPQGGPFRFFDFFLFFLIAYDTVQRFLKKPLLLLCGCLLPFRSYNPNAPGAWRSSKRNSAIISLIFLFFVCFLCVFMLKTWGSGVNHPKWVFGLVDRKKVAVTVK